MGFDITITLLVLILAFLALVFDIWTPDAILMTAVGVVTAAGVISLEQAVRQFGNTTILALGTLYIVAASLRNSGALDYASEFILGKGSQNIRKILFRMTPGVSIYSGFLNNTPIVAMGIPAIRRWARKYNVSSSKLLIPLSYAAILGGMCTLIGTSTNLIAHGLLQSNNLAGFSFFELAWLGVPCAIIGLIYIIIFSPKLTPDRSDIRDEEEAQRKSLVELEITEEAALVGETVEEANLQQLPGFQLVRINRHDNEIAPVPEDEKLRVGDHLFYAPQKGFLDLAPDLTDYPGLRLAFKPPRDIKRDEKKNRELHQVVVKEGSRLVGSTVEEAKLLDRFGAAVTGVRRGEKRIRENLGDFVLRPGDVLLLDTKRGFQQAHEDSQDFYLTSEAGGEAPSSNSGKDPKNDLGKDLYVSLFVLAGIITSVTAGIFHIALAGILGVAVLLAFNVIEPGDAKESIDWTVLIVIGAALGLGKAMEVSGAAELIGNGMLSITSDYGPRIILTGLVLVTALLTETITNNGAIALMFPIALSVAQSQGFDPRAFIASITLVSSMALLTPIGYQTNLMVYGPGNYKFTDFFKVGFPLAITLWIIVIILAPIIWPL
ncbi:SLC13 family permease [Aliifodinibius salipaludis]|uniref:SLC13 family permease n=1 Tax=Fodinibius salipaludis TaxID=2032627 RepID=A0A2A2GD84_9BACT|nr:SLC13 family permease [Aliifodinibius salipaludis]PAU95140.1 SLC13 family permease [Aliifodinibius salipaludis]